MLLAVVSLFSWGLGAGTIAMASTSSEKVHVQNAMEILVSPSGLRNLESEVVGPFLKDIGWDPEQWDAEAAGKREWSYRSGTVIRLDELPAEFLRYRATFQDIADEIRPWLRGFEPRDPLPDASLPGLWYEAQPRRMGIRNVQGGEAGWIHAEFVAEFDWFHWGASRGTIRDLNNEWLGKVEFEEPQFRGRELKLSIPFSCRLLTGTRDFEIRLESVISNFDSISSEFTYKKVELPKIRLEIDGEVKGEFKIEEKFRERQEELVGALQVFLQRYGRLKLAGDLNPHLASQWKNLLQIDLVLAPPGTPDDQQIFPHEQFLYQFLPAAFEYSSLGRYLRLGWDLRVRDLSFPDRSDGVHEYAARGKADFSALGGERFDVGVALNPDLVTHAMDLAIQNRGLFSPTPFDPGDPTSLLYRIAGPPRFLGVQRLEDGSAAWKVSVELGIRKPGWYSTLFAGGEGRLRVVALVRPIVISEAVMDFQVSGLDLENSGLLPESVRTKLLKGLVHHYARKQLRLKDREYSKRPFSLYPFKLADAYLGVPMLLKSVTLDQTGHLLLALEQRVSGFSQPTRSADSGGSK
jgi:hypothetical protein